MYSQMQKQVVPSSKSWSKSSNSQNNNHILLIALKNLAYCRQPSGIVINAIKGMASKANGTCYQRHGKQGEWYLLSKALASVA